MAVREELGSRGDNSEPKLQGLPTKLRREAAAEEQKNHGILLYGKKRLELSKKTSSQKNMASTALCGTALGACIVVMENSKMYSPTASRTWLRVETAQSSSQQLLLVDGLA